jgi:hypothetical protein
MIAMFIKGEKDTLEIMLNPEKNVFMFRGESFPENPPKFFTPVIEWIEEYSDAPNEQTIVDFDVSYMNTASSKTITRIVGLFIELGATIRWFYDAEDEDALYEAEDIKEIYNNTDKIIIIGK